EPLPDPVFEVLLYFLVIESLEQQPGSVAEVEERFVVLINEVATIGANFQLRPLDRMVDTKERRLRQRIRQSPVRRWCLRWAVQSWPGSDHQCDGRWGTRHAQQESASILHACTPCAGKLSAKIRSPVTCR